MKNYQNAKMHRLVKENSKWDRLTDRLSSKINRIGFERYKELI